ncbi:hypothetical protein O7634_11440 [Micromonospora sp. WMMD1120]|uniref:hypothetical protein n=1 Tax=Micromonospora sp. WMMD1120 TaxID=3016106 RepID=UPI002417B037|nr:hypothetical protein [Micromonospora sp. WMMD1120]MDG4807363.1 hypothetical protein [Micromonospora sp. WMMD1120]
MTGATMLVAALLLAAAALVAWPVRSVRLRRRRVLGSCRTSGVDPDDALVEWIRELGRTPDAPADGPTAASTPGHPVGGAPAVRTTAQADRSRTVLGWPSRNVTGSPSWPAAAVRLTRPEGPIRPPTRRDPRRPAGAARGDVLAVAVAEDRGGSEHREAVDAADRAPDEVGSPARVRTPRMSSRLLLPLVGLVGGGVGAVLGGPVAAVAMSGYGTLMVRAVRRWRVNRQVERVRRGELDRLCGLAADLRAGLPAPHLIEVTTESRDGSDRLRHLTAAAVRLADRTGAPLAELVERIEADARATDRGMAAAAAQAAGARATAWLLAALPVGGIGLGYGIGVDPMAVLLHSAVGGACAVAAVALQVVGLLWAERLGATPGRA